MFVNAIMYYKVRDPTSAVANVDDYSGSARLLAATTLRNVLGTKNLGDILSERESIASEMQELLHEATDPWGVTVERVEVKDVRVPEQLQRAMAAEAEAAREARAKVIAAEGEHKASRALRHAAEIIMDNPAALQVILSLLLFTIQSFFFPFLREQFFHTWIPFKFLYFHCRLIFHKGFNRTHFSCDIYKP